jgi:cardiolipin synthase
VTRSAPSAAKRFASAALALLPLLSDGSTSQRGDELPVVTAPRSAAATPGALLEHHRGAIVATLGGPLVGGNRAELLVDGPETHGAMFAAIAGARASVNLETYILEDDEVGDRLARLLLDKRAQGVVVNVLYDSLGSLATRREYFERLRAGDVAVCEFNPVSPLRASVGLGINNRNHRKILVVDGTSAFTGGINISGVYSAGSAGSGRSRSAGWRDTHVTVAGPVVADFQRLFLATWARQGCPGPEEAAYFPPLPARGARAMRLVAGDPEAGESETQRAILAAVGSAQQRAWLTYGYFVPDPPTLAALTAAARRGVDVRLALPGFSDFWAPLHAGRSHYDTLLAAGVRIHERQDRLLHAKTAVVDGVVTSIGSTNLDWRSFVHNFEADLLVLDAGFGERMEQLFAADVAASREITLAAWRARGMESRGREWLARRFAYLL